MSLKAEFEVRPMRVGAEIYGLDLTRELTGAGREALYGAWLRYGFLVFPGSVTDTPSHLKLSRYFGELEKHPLPEIWVDGEPYLIQLGGKNRNRAYVYDGDLRINRNAWHRDTAYTIDVCKGAALRMVDIPPQAGQTILADTAMAYDALPEALKKRIETLECKATLRLDPMRIGIGGNWQVARPATEDEWPGGSPVVDDTILARYPSVIQPLVVTHPESGRKCLYMSPTYVDHVIGLSQDESDTLVRELCAYMTDNKYCYSHSWQANQVLLWDNRRCLHSTTGYDPKYNRLGYRTTLAGSMRTGRYFDPAQARDHVHTFSADRD